MDNYNFKNIKKLVFINFSILLLLLLSYPILYKLFVFSKNIIESLDNKGDPRQFYNLYKDKSFSKQLFYDLRNLERKYKYVPYLEWKKIKFSSKTTNISGKYNSRKSLNESLENSSWFFGGSSMWGVGEDDANTIPSLYSKLTKKAVYNFGESAWVSRQSLNQFINVLGDGYKPKEVIFLSGYNDIVMQCRNELSEYMPTHSYAGVFEKRLNPLIKKENLLLNEIINFFYHPYKRLSVKVKRPIPGCLSNPERGNEIANHLIKNWEIAYYIAKTNGANFKAILQPTAFSGNKNIKYLKINPSSKDVLEVKKVYSVIEDKIRSTCKNKNSKKDFCQTLIIGTKWMKNNEPYFIDFVHVSRKGNKFMANKIAESFK